MRTPVEDSSRRKGPAGPVAAILAALAVAACGDPGGGADAPPRRITVPTGTEIRVTLDRELGTRASAAGDRFTARVSEPVAVAGRVAVPRGAVLHGRVLGVEERGGTGVVLRLGFLTLRVRGGSPILSARLVEVRPEVRTVAGQPAARVGKAAAAGGRIGTIVRSGPDVGAVTGSGVVLATRDARAVLPEGSVMRIELTEPIRVRVPPRAGRNG